MRQIGLYVALFGIFSIVLNFLGYNLKLLMWIDNWGEMTGWIIRAALIIVGAAIFFLIPAPVEEPAADESASE